MQKVNWLVVGIISIIVILFLFGGGIMLGGGGMMGNWGYGGPGMMGHWGYSPFGWIGMLFMLLIPIGIIALIVFGVIWFVRNVGNSAPPSSQSPCPNCGKAAQADWQNCPYCGAALK